jgi:hypothetical protein
MLQPRLLDLVDGLSHFRLLHGEQSDGAGILNVLHP